MGSQPSRTQVTEQQPAVSLKSKSVFLQISLITFNVRRKGHVHKQEVFDINFIVFKKLLISDFYCTSQGCQQSCHANQKVFICILLGGFFVCEDHASSALGIPLPLYYASCHSVRDPTSILSSYDTRRLFNTYNIKSFFFLPFFKKDFWCRWGPFLKFYWICYNIASVPYFGLFARRHWELSSPTRDQTCTACIGRWSLTTGSPGKSPFFLLQRCCLRHVHSVASVVSSTLRPYRL